LLRYVSVYNDALLLFLFHGMIYIEYNISITLCEMITLFSVNDMFTRKQSDLLFSSKLS